MIINTITMKKYLSLSGILFAIIFVSSFAYFYSQGQNDCRQAFLCFPRWSFYGFPWLFISMPLAGLFGTWLLGLALYGGVLINLLVIYFLFTKLENGYRVTKDKSYLIIPSIIFLLIMVGVGIHYYNNWVSKISDPNTYYKNSY